LTGLTYHVNELLTLLGKGRTSQMAFRLQIAVRWQTQKALNT
jgi:hypothetical protein